MISWIFRLLYKLLRLLTSRLLVFSVLLILQITFVILLILWLSASSVVAFFFFYLISILIVLFLLNKDDNPSYKLAWTIFILAAPILGGIFYLIFGNKNFSRKKKAAFANYRTRNPDIYAAEQGDLTLLTDQLPYAAQQASYLIRTAGLPPYTNTEVIYCPSGEEMHRRMLEELPRAKHFILMEYFIIEQGEMFDPILEILWERAAAGVKVMLMYDDVGCISKLPYGFASKVEKMGITVHVFNRFHPSIDPYMNYRDHRKICVIDGLVGFCGGANLADEYINAVSPHGHWKDTAVMLRGPAVYNLTRSFLQLWGLSRNEDIDLSAFVPERLPVSGVPGFVQPYCDSPLDHFQVAESVYLQIINHSERYVWFTTPYLILDNELLTALKLAAQSGVDVRIVTPHVADKHTVFAVTRSYYHPLLMAGVKIYEYTPGFIHAKMCISDDRTAVVGTANLDFRSLFLHHECGVLLLEHPVISQIRSDFEQIFSVSSPVSISDLESAPFWQRWASFLLKPFSPLI